MLFASEAASDFPLHERLSTCSTLVTRFEKEGEGMAVHLLRIQTLPARHELQRLFSTVAPALKSVATRLELLDERGDSAMFEQRDSFDADLKELRSRYQELLHAPPLADASLLPELTIIRDALCFNRTYRNFLIRQLRSERHSNAVRELGEAVEETQDLQSIWSAMFDARDEHNGVIFRRLRLKKLMELIGQKAYYAKDFPLPAPLKRFNVKETPNSWK